MSNLFKILGYWYALPVSQIVSRIVATQALVFAEPSASLACVVAPPASTVVVKVLWATCIANRVLPDQKTPARSAFIRGTSLTSLTTFVAISISDE